MGCSLELQYSTIIFLFPYKNTISSHALVLLEFKKEKVLKTRTPGSTFCY
jgi:hypothetical protein